MATNHQTNMNQPTYGCMEWTILTAGLMMTTFSYSSVWGTFNQWTSKSTAWRDAENSENEALFFAILCGHGTNKTVKKWKTRVGTLKETFEEFMRSGVQKETSTSRRKEYKDSVKFHSSQSIRPFILPWN